MALTFGICKCLFQAGADRFTASATIASKLRQNRAGRAEKTAGQPHTIRDVEINESVHDSDVIPNRLCGKIRASCPPQTLG